MKATFGANSVAIQGVDYAADIVGAGTGAVSPKDAAGAKNMVAMVQKVAGACPMSKVVLSGYSQGAEQVRGALMGLGTGTVGGGVVAVGSFSFTFSSYPPFLFRRFLRKALGLGANFVIRLLSPLAIHFKKINSPILIRRRQR